MALNFDDDITARIKRQRKQQMAASMGKTVQQMEEDSEYFNEIKEIETEEIAENKALSASDEDYAPESIPLSSDYRKGLQRIKGPPVKESTVGGLENLGEEALPVIQAEARMRGREFRENQTPSLSPETELTGESINPWDVNKSSETGEYAIGHSPWSGPAEEPSVGGLEDLGREAHSKSNVDEALKRMRIREYEESQNPPSLTPEDPELAGVRTEGWLDSTIEEPMGMLEDLRAEKRAGEFGDVERDENDPAVEQMKKVQDNPKDREEVFRGMPKEEKAMAKEELGNYYIGPGGYAINLNTLEASRERAVNMSLLQFVPAHAKAQMLASWGYIDQEDVDNMPESPTVTAAQVKADGEYAKQVLISETDLSKTDKTTKSVLDVTKYQVDATERINTSNNVTKKALQLSDRQVQELQIDSNEWMFLEGNELKEYMQDRDIELEGDKLAALESHQLATINLGYSKIKSAEKIEQNLLTQRGKEWTDKYNAMTTQEQRAAVLQAHTQSMDVITMAMGSGQTDLAAIVGAEMGLAWIPDIDAYWKSNAKSSALDPALAGVLKKHYPLMKGSVVAGKYSSEKSALFSRLRKSKGEDQMYSNLDNWIMEDETRGKPWADMKPAEKEQYNSKEHWKATKLVEAVHHGLQNGAYSEYHKAVTSRNITIDPSGGGEGTGTGTGGTGGTGTGGDAETEETYVEPEQEEAVTLHEQEKLLADTEKRKRSGARQRNEKKRRISPVEGITSDSYHNFGAESYSDEMVSKILGIGDYDWNKGMKQTESGISYFGLKDWLHTPAADKLKKKKDFTSKEINQKLDAAYNEGEKYFKRLLKSPKYSKHFSTVEEAAIYFNKSGGTSSKGAGLSPSAKYYISEVIKRNATRKGTKKNK